jgi:hypothetical protein
MQVNEPDSFYEGGPDITIDMNGTPWAAWWGFTDPLHTIDEIFTVIWDPESRQWLSELIVSDLDSSEDYNPSVYIDQEGEVWCAWTGTIPGRGTEIFYARWDSLSGWHEEGLVNEPDSMNDGGIVIGGASEQMWAIYIGYNTVDLDRREMYATQWTGAEWGPETVIVDLGYGYVGGMEAAFDQMGNPHVAWAWSGSNIYYVFFDGSSWSDPMQVTEPDSSGEDDLDPGIAVDDEGRVHLVWAANSAENQYDYEIMYRCFDGENWSEEVNINHADGYGDYRPRVAAASPENVRVAWDKGYSFWEHHMRAIHFNGIGWENEEVISDSAIMFNACNAITIDNMGNSWVVWDGIEDPVSTKAEIFSNVHFSS